MARKVTKHRESINEFMRGTLKLRITNIVWSFDATADDGVVVMKLWQKDRQTLPNGTERIGVWRPVPAEEVKLGRKERLHNVQRLKAGETTFAIVRGFPDSHDKAPFVYENDRLYKLGRVEVDPNGTEYAIVERVVSIDEFLNRDATEVSAFELSSLLATLGAPVVLTKNNKPDAEKNYRVRPGHPGDMLDGFWTGQPAAVEPGAAFALHLVERNQEVWIGDYLGAIEDAGSRFSLIVGNVQHFKVTDLDLANPAQQRLRDALRQPGAVTYSYIDSSHWDGYELTGSARAPEGPAYKMAQVKRRLHQQVFRTKVFSRYGKACVVTGCDVEELLEAAHLAGSRWQDGDNDAQHGIPLRVDIHRAYDKGLLTLDQNHRIVDLDPALEQHYGQYRQR